MIQQEVIDRMIDNPIIAAVSDMDDIMAAADSPCEFVFILESSIFELKEYVSLLHQRDKLVFLHFDLMKGIGHDHVGLEYLKQTAKPDGIITTKTSIIKKSKELGLFTVQRLFVLDSKSIDMGLRSISEARPDFVELMPGVIPKTIARLSCKMDVPIIAGGLIDSKKEIISALDAGAIGISTSMKSLWLA